jgi:hypothetical protein
MTINAWKTNFIGLNKPSKVLSGIAESFVSLNLWPYANGEDDPYWSGGVNPQYYRWQVTFTVNERLHGSHLTRTPFRFNAQDIEVGDFVAGAQDGKVLQIMSIISKTNSEIVAIVEDRLRYNTFRDPSGFGLFTTPGQVIFFQINELGYPMLDPVPGEAAVDFADNVMSRFQYLNPLINYLLEKENNGFQQGDAICIKNGEFVLSDATNVDKFVGTVVHPGPGPHQFILRPANGIIDFVPSLPGDVGDYIYPSIDGSGDLTTNDASRRPIYMKVARSITSVTTGTTANPTGNNGDVIEFNRKMMTLEGVDGVYTLDDVVDIINNDTFYHKITASKVGAATNVTSDIANAGSAYGIIAGYSPFSATINGVLVEFTTTTSGGAAYGDPAVADVNDMVYDINLLEITDIVASVTDGSNLTLTHTAGGSIEIINVTPDANGNNFAGTNSLTSLALSTPANTTSYALRLERTDGGPITIRDVQGEFLSNAGVMSGQTGRYALGLNIEQGLRSSRTVVVANIMARDALYPIVGDQAYVLNDENGEWAFYIYNGSAWTGVGGQRSFETDAKTAEMTITFPSADQPIVTVSGGRKILNVSITIVDELTVSDDFDFDIMIGTTSLWKYSNFDVVKSGTYIEEPSYITPSRQDLRFVIGGGTATGTIQIQVTYL